jgi:salicylate hydroxylase
MQCCHTCLKVGEILRIAIIPLTVVRGAAMAVEDGAALAEVLSKIDNHNQIPTAMKVFATERIKRTSQMHQASLINGKLWHFADGPEQEARDKAMRPEVEGRPFLESPNQWSDPLTAVW